MTNLSYILLAIAAGFGALASIFAGVYVGGLLVYQGFGFYTWISCLFFSVIPCALCCRLVGFLLERIR